MVPPPMAAVAAAVSASSSSPSGLKQSDDNNNNKNNNNNVVANNNSSSAINRRKIFRRSSVSSLGQDNDDVVPGRGWSNGDVAPQMFPVTQEGRLQLYGRHRRWIGLADGWTRIGEGHEHGRRHGSSRAAGGSLVGDCADRTAAAVRGLIAQLCEQFYRQGWATGTGGGVSIRTGDGTASSPFRVFVAPSGIQKEDMIGDDVFELDMNRAVVTAPRTPGLRQSACTPLWYCVYRARPASRCVLHTHSMNAVLATLLDATETAPCLRVTHQEMLKGVGHHAYDDVLEIPIIDNRPTEDALAAQLRTALERYPRSNAVLVRRHGIYCWGDSWEQAKTQAESFDYLFETAVKMKSMGLDFSAVPKHGTYRVNDDNVEESEQEEKETKNGNKKKRKAEEEEKKNEDDDNDHKMDVDVKEKKNENNENSNKKARLVVSAVADKDEKKNKTRQQETSSSTEQEVQGFRGAAAGTNGADLLSNAVPILPRDYQHLVLDIEGCTSSIAFVHNVLFPYVREKLTSYLAEHYPNKESEQYKSLVSGLARDVKQVMMSSSSNDEEPKPDDNHELFSDASAMVLWLMDRDVKSAALKDLQGSMWKAGYQDGTIQGHAYSDFVPMLRWMKDAAVKVYIYSSGSVAAQKLLFGHLAGSQGNVLPYLSGHFDIPTAGNKKEAASYANIAAALNVKPSEIVFASDSEAELAAATAAGIGRAVMTIRPGNAPLTEHGKKAYPAVHSLLQLCGA